MPSVGAVLTAFAFGCTPRPIPEVEPDPAFEARLASIVERARASIGYDAADDTTTVFPLGGLTEGQVVRLHRWNRELVP